MEESEPEKMGKKEESGRTVTSPICMRKRKSRKRGREESMKEQRETERNAIKE